MRTPKIILDTYERKTKEMDHFDYAKELMDSLRETANSIEQIIEDFTSEGIAEGRAKMGVALAFADLSLTGTQYKYGFAPMEHEQICNELFKVEEKEDDFDDMEF